ncbi:MAG: hypothetical protein M1404_04895 [Acidobacteria bacterium]|nr:hypothetical protein [Acidobacteriota bacterium]
MKTIVYSVITLFLLVPPALGQQQPTRNVPNPLIDGKLMYVGRMPENLDSWIVVDLRSWGKYKPTRDPEGVDLVMEAEEPERSVEYEMRQGVPQPRRVERRREDRGVMFRIVVADWVTRRPVWQADILDKKPKKGHREITKGTHSEIYARGLSNQELAEEILRTLRSYVDYLSSENGATPGPAPQS